MREGLIPTYPSGAGRQSHHLGEVWHSIVAVSHCSRKFKTTGVAAGEILGEVAVGLSVGWPTGGISRFLFPNNEKNLFGKCQNNWNDGPMFK